MCGIFGVLGLGVDNPHKREILKKAISQLGHRGPDAWGIYVSSAVGLGHTRLSIIDVNEGHQPMCASEYVISFNGEIYNYIELRQSLESQGYRFKTKSDTEVLLTLYRAEGEACFAKLNGQFAVLIWDKKRSQLVVARDRYGIRPLYALEHGGYYYFSSEMKAFDTLSNYQREITPQGLFEHALLWNTLLDDTIYKRVRSIESGTYEVFSLNGLQQKCRYYQVGENFHSENQTPDFEASKQQFHNLMQNSVRLRLRSDVPVGAYLSGGIDSTVISELVNKQTNHEFKTFSVAFADKSFDESEFQLLASKQIGSTHQVVNIQRKDIDKYMSHSIFHTERPIFRTAPVPLHLLSKKVGETDIKVVLTGEGADEILFGYDTFKELKILSEWKAGAGDALVTESIKKLYPHLDHYADTRQVGFMKMYYKGFIDDFENEFCGLNIRIANNKIVKNFFNKDLGVTFDKDVLRERLKRMLPEAYPTWSLLQKNSFLEIKTLLQGYLLSSQGDRMAMGNSVEGRFPFLDHRVVEMVFAMPDEFKLNGFDQKHILKETYKHTIPAEITNRPKQPYMAPDLTAFIGGEGQLSELAGEMFSTERIKKYGLFDQKMVARFLNKFKNGVPEQTGYRDNMLFIFMLTTQLSQFWIDHLPDRELDLTRCVVDITDE